MNHQRRRRVGNWPGRTGVTRFLRAGGAHRLGLSRETVGQFKKSVRSLARSSVGGAKLCNIAYFCTLLTILKKLRTFKVQNRPQGDGRGGLQKCRGARERANRHARPKSLS